MRIYFISWVTTQRTLEVEIDIPPTEQIIREAIEALRLKDPALLKLSSIRNNFSDVVEAVFKETHRMYVRYEQATVDYAAERLVDATSQETFSKEEIKCLVMRAMADARQIEKSLKQSRANRAGKAFEIIVRDLLSDIGIGWEKVTREDRESKLRRIDIVIPDRSTAVKTPDRAHFLSLKTSLKERWKQVAEEQTQGQRTRLLTLLQNEVISNEVARKITGRGIFLYVPDRVKNDRFADNPRIRGLSDLPSDVS